MLCREDSRSLTLSVVVAHSGLEFASFPLTPNHLPEERKGLGTMRDHEPSAARLGARAPWTAATESSESPLWAVRPCRRWASGSCKAPNPKLEIPKKLQAPSSK